MRQLEQVHNRRKAFIYVSNGYDLDPFAKTREERSKAIRQSAHVDNSDGSTTTVNPNDPTLRNPSNQFAFADLVSDLAEVTRSANRANTTIYTIDPAGLVGGPTSTKDRHDGVPGLRRSSQDSLRVLADLTGGMAVVNQNDFTKALKRIDQETALLRGRLLLEQSRSDEEAPVHRGQGEAAGANVWNRTSYTLKTPPSRAVAVTQVLRSRSRICLYNRRCRGRAWRQSTYIVCPVNLVRPWSSQ